MVKRPAIRRAVMAAALAITLAACAGDGDGDASPRGGADRGAGDVQDAERLVDVAKRDLVERFGYAEADVRVLSVESVTWPDGALGCPRPDRSYTQALVDGYRIELQWQDVEHTYHGAHDADPFLCEKLD
ncbi:MAG TPA: hypothetical protein VF230_10975 [Acidimicrobiales bacterium]